MILAGGGWLRYTRLQASKAFLVLALFWSTTCHNQAFFSLGWLRREQSDRALSRFHQPV